MKKIISSFSFMLIMIVMSGCKSTQTNVSKGTLTATSWQLSTVMGKTVSSSDYAKGLPDATFSADDKISGNGGCNRYSGTYTLEENGKISFGPMLSTKMFCPGGGEEGFMRAMGQVNTAKIDGKNLVLSNGNNDLLVFIPGKK